MIRKTSELYKRHVNSKKQLYDGLHNKHFIFCIVKDIRVLTFLFGYWDKESLHLMCSYTFKVYILHLVNLQCFTLKQCIYCS